MALAAYNRVIQNEQGGLQTSATVSIVNAETGMPAEVWQDRAGTVSLGSSYTATSGVIEFYATPGRYNVTATKGGFTETYTDELIGTTADGGVSRAKVNKDIVTQVATITERDALTGLVDGQQISVAETGYIYKYVLGTDSFEELPGRFKGDDGKLYQVVSAILRQDSAGSGWYVLNDAGHAPIGLDPVTPVGRLGDDIVLNYNFTSNKVGTMVMSPDEGYTISGVDFGASIGTSQSFISAFYPFWVKVSGTASVSHSYFGAKGADWDAVVDIAAGTWTVTHPSESHSDAAGSVVAVEGYGDDNTATAYEVVSRSRTGFTVEARQLIHGRTSGVNVLTDNVGPQSASWDGVDTLTITHPQSASANDAVISSRSPQYNAAIIASTDTTITVQFYDIATGALFTGGSRPTEVYYQRGGKAACAITGSTKFKAQRLGKCQLNADNVAGGASNVQVYGVFELDL